MKFSVVILAAGIGRRMHTPNMPKVLAEINGKPLIHYVLNTAFSLQPDKICIVVGHQKELVINYVQNEYLPEFSNCPPRIVKFAVQVEQLGSGDAVKASAPNFENYAGDILVLSGDVPLISYDTLKNFIQRHKVLESDLSVLSAISPIPYGYGRIVRNQENIFTHIVEEKDASNDIKSINEINSGIYFANAKLLFDALSQVKNDNNQTEYYLTDIVKICFQHNKRVEASNISTFKEIQGVNTREQLKKVEKMMQ